MNLHYLFRKAINSFEFYGPSSSSHLLEKYSPNILSDIEPKIISRLNEILMPYNSFFGISNYLKCTSNKPEIFSVQSLMYFHLIK